MRNREFVFTPKIQYKLVAERSEANQNSLTFPFWCSILELVRTHFSEKIPPQKFGKAAACTERSRSEPHRSKPQKNPEKNIGSNHILILGEENFLILMKTVGFIYAIAAAVTWGLVYTIDQKILDKVSPLSLLFIDSVLIAIITLPILFFDSQSIKVLLGSGKLNLGLIFVSVVLATLANFFIFSGIKILGASTTSIFEIAYPFFVILFSFLIFRTSLNLYFLLGSVFIFVGSLIIIKLA